MKVVAIIQARMGSTRLPGKVIRQVLEKPLLEYQLERVGRAKLIDEIIMATTDQKIDDPIVLLCKTLGISYYRGSENDVLNRYFEAASQAKADVVVRLTADCPLIDPVQIDKVIERYLLLQYELLYVSNVLKRSFPRGMDTEVFSVQALKEADQKAKAKLDREHVTKYMVNNIRSFHLENVTNNQDDSHHRWTVDTIEDFIFIKRIIETLYPHKPNFTMEDIITLLDQFPKWRMINSHIEQKND